ncbi:regulator of G protein signaling domain protein [Ancylostoma caninum]|uniref:Regulator of G protein signaling domain protein n=1 Tax=Ancylostoma caninum TaxID=29170 RepID=A0A368HA94_ANCCA|nr:regulator of G protein signaling domain protein [Ancylostoma caninum]
MLMKILICDCDFMGQNHSSTVGTEKKPSSSTTDNLDKPTYEVVYAWSQSFENLMKNKLGQKYFAEFLKGEYSDENILFWQACEELKREKNAEKIEEKARIIYEDFISILSPKEVSLDSRVREIVNTNMSRPSSATFDEAQNQIYTLMQRDSYPSSPLPYVCCPSSSISKCAIPDNAIKSTTKSDIQDEAEAL